MATKPEWWSNQRGALLAQVSQAAGGRCKYGHYPCSGLEHPDHWIEWEPKRGVQFEAERIEFAKQGRDGLNPYRLDFAGNVRTTLAWKPKVVISYEPKLMGKLELVQEALIGSWRDAQRELARIARQTTPTGELGRFGSHFDPVSRDVFMAARPDYYLVGHGVSAWTKRRVVVVRVPSTFIFLFIDLSKTRLSNNARHKIKRYGKWPVVPVDASLTEDKLIRLCVEDFWARVGTR